MRYTLPKEDTNMKMYFITLGKTSADSAVSEAYVRDLSDIRLTFLTEGLEVEGETERCWILKELRDLLPVRIRQSHEFIMQRNEKCIYMYGRDKRLLTKAWNDALTIKAADIRRR